MSDEEDHSKKPWWQTGLGPPPSADKTRRRKERAQAREEFRATGSFRFWTGLGEYFEDAAPSSWEYALVVCRFETELDRDPRVEIIGPRNGPAYGAMSDRFIEAMRDLSDYREKHGNGLGLTVRFAMNRVGDQWSVAMDPWESQVQEWMRLLGYDDWTPAPGEVFGDRILGKPPQTP